MAPEARNLATAREVSTHAAGPDNGFRLRVSGQWTVRTMPAKKEAKVTDGGADSTGPSISPARDGAVDDADGAHELGGARDKADRAWQVAQLASKLMAHRVEKLRAAGRRADLSDEYFDEEFSGALLRAQWLLSQAEEHEYEVGAYQVFKEGEDLTEADIFKQFKRAGWNGLSSKVPVTDLMNELREWMGGLGKAASEHSPLTTNLIVARAYERVSRSLSALRKDCDVRDAFPRFDDSAQALLESLTDALEGDRTTQSERVEHHNWMIVFIDWCFPFETGAKRELRRYRPHEIFLFAAIKGWDAQAGGGGRLVRRGTDLKDKFVPGRKRATLEELYVNSFRKFSASNPLITALGKLPKAKAGDASARGDDEQAGAS